MTAPADRILDLALREVLGGEEPPDLTLRILAAARAGTGLSGVPAPAQARPRRTWRPVLMAASLLAAAVAATWLVLRPTETQPVATSPTALLAVQGGQAVEARRFAAGQTVVTREVGGQALTLGRGARLTLGPRTALTLGAADADPALTLLVGSLRAVPEGDRALVLDTPQGRILLAADTTADVEVLGHPWLAPDAFLEQARAGDLASAPERGAVVLSLEAGRATLSRAGVPRDLERGEFLVLWPDGDADRALLPPATAREELSALLAEARLSSEDVKLEGRERMLAMKGAASAAERLAARLYDEPDLWSWVRPRLHRLPRSPERNDAKRRLLQVLLGDGDSRTRELFVRVLATDPGVIDLESVLVLAEQGLEAASGRLRAILAEPGAEGRSDNVYPALYFAMRGDGRGRATLRAAWANVDLPNWNQPAYYAAAAGLVFLGEASAWDEMIARLEQRVTTAIEQGQLESARMHVLTAAYFHRMIQRVQPSPVSYTRARVLQWERETAVEAGTAGEIRALLESIRAGGR